jgi:hypothetical protein
MKNTTQLLSMAAAITMMTAPSQAATIWNGNGDGSSWIDGSNWTSGVPSGGEVVTIGSGFTVNAPSTVDLATFDLSLEGTLNFGAGANYSAGGTITVSGNGHLIGVSNAFIAPSTTAPTTFNLEGDTAQISNFAQLGSHEATDPVNWNLTPGATGINTIAMTGAGWHGFLLNGIDNLTVDLSGYNIANGDNLTLFTYNTLYGDTFESVVINGDALGTLGSGTSTAFDAGDWSGDFVFGANSVSLSNLVAVPEPGTYALISGCLALGAVMLRRRRA